MIDDPYLLKRFREAQDRGVYERALAEVRAGSKRSHWMWFIFPQIDGLGFSPTTEFYAIKSVDEARAYLADEVLGTRLREICQALLDLEDSDPGEIFGYPDDLKLKSSLTLFDYVSPGDLFATLLDKFYGGDRDKRSLELIGSLEKA